MTNPIKAIHSYLLMLRASTYQGKADFQKVIDISERARLIDPRSKFAFVFLGDDYYRIGEYDKAVEVLTEALRFYPKDFQLNFFMAQTLAKKKVPIPKVVPFLKTYLEEKPKDKGRFPLFVKALMRILRKDFDLDSYAGYTDHVLDQRTKWAESVLAEYERQQVGLK
jgi:tetratricopeptide (TPR) repeat protein